MHPEKRPVPVDRIMKKLDLYLSRKDLKRAEKLLRYWLAEAEACRDRRGMLTVLNEQIGLYRKTGREAECLQAISAALALSDELGMEGTVSFGTTLINAATGYKAFGKVQEALMLYERARGIYESSLGPEDERLAALYNNMALALTENGDFREAEALFMKAVKVMNGQENGALEAAITWLNLADLANAELGPADGAEKTEAYLEKAEELLNTQGLPRNGYYAFVCEKCAPVFGYYGYFLTEQELNERARNIYERA